MFLNLILPLFGILILIFTIGAYAFKYGEAYRASNQMFKGLGLEIQVSVITIYIIIGLVFCGAGIFLGVRNDDAKNKLMVRENDSLRKQLVVSARDFATALESLKSENITYGFSLDSAFYKNNFPAARSLKCTYYNTWDRSQYTIYPVVTGLTRGSYQVTIRHLNENELAGNSPGLVIDDNQAHLQWICGAFNPLHPTIKLEKNVQKNQKN